MQGGSYVDRYELEMERSEGLNGDYDGKGPDLMWVPSLPALYWTVLLRWSQVGQAAMAASIPKEAILEKKKYQSGLRGNDGFCEMD